MDEKTTYWASVILSAFALVLLVINISLSNSNRNMQVEVSQRQATINGGGTLGQIDKGLVQALADISVKNSDTEARDLLAAQGITLKANAKTEDAKEPKETKKKPDNMELQ